MAGVCVSGASLGRGAGTDGSGRTATVHEPWGAEAPPNRVLRGQRMRFSQIARGLLAGGVLFVASAASALPVVYFFQSGDITISATVAR